MVDPAAVNLPPDVMVKFFAMFIILLFALTPAPEELVLIIFKFPLIYKLFCKTQLPDGLSNAT